MSVRDVREQRAIIYLEKFTMCRTGKLVALLAVLLFLPSAIASAQTASEKRYDDARRYFERRSLEGVEKIETAISFVSDEAKRAGPDVRAVDEAVRARLARAGIRAVPVGAAHDASLTVTLLPRYDRSRSVWVVAVTLDLRQMATLDRTREPHVAVTWQRSDVVITTEDWKEVREALARMVDEFAEDYRLANP